MRNPFDTCLKGVRDRRESSRDPAAEESYAGDDGDRDGSCDKAVFERCDTLLATRELVLEVREGEDDRVHTILLIVVWSEVEVGGGLRFSRRVL